MRGAVSSGTTTQNHQGRLALATALCYLQIPQCIPGCAKGFGALHNKTPIHQGPPCGTALSNHIRIQAPHHWFFQLYGINARFVQQSYTPKTPACLLIWTLTFSHAWLNLCSTTHRYSSSPSCSIHTAPYQATVHSYGTMRLLGAPLDPKPQITFRELRQQSARRTTINQKPNHAPLHELSTTLCTSNHCHCHLQPHWPPTQEPTCAAIRDTTH
jgi:hypothetical protein